MISFNLLTKMAYPQCPKSLFCLIRSDGSLSSTTACLSLIVEQLRHVKNAPNRQHGQSFVRLTDTMAYHELQLFIDGKYNPLTKMPHLYVTNRQ